MNNQFHISLQFRILIGYIILIATIVGMTSILLYERERLKSIDIESKDIRTIRCEINTVHRHITRLATQGESVITWEEADYNEYCVNRLRTDSLLNILKNRCREYIQPSQIDSLRRLLVKKEMHFLHIMQTLRQQKEREYMLANQLPEVVKRATKIRIVETKKKGIAGFFGGKKEV